MHDSPGKFSWGDGGLKLVEKYSRRDLTQAEDKLPAVSSLARSIAIHTKDTYYGGLWKSCIIEGLNWKLHVHEPHHFCNDPVHDAEIAKVDPAVEATIKFPSAYRAPSWS